MEIIINPIAGGKHGKKIKKALLAVINRLHERKIKYTIHQTEKKGHAKELTAKLISEGATTIVALGGDGTLHEVINGFTSFENTALGLIPCGTGNDFATALGLPKDPVKALDLILDTEPKYTDFMQMPTVRGINIIGMGIDVDVLKKYESLKKKTKLGYTKCLIKTLFDFDYTDFTVEIDGEKTIDYRSFIACIANGHVFGGGIPICPIANPTDNELNFVAVREIKRSKIINAFLKLKKGKILTLSQSEHTPCKKVKITTKQPYTVNVDGELYDDIPFEIEIVSNKLKMFR